MTHLRTWTYPITLGLLWCFALTGASTLHAQTNPSLPSGQGDTFTLSASRADGTRLDTAALRGNVAVVFYWATGCAVCRDSLPELRANLTGWRDKPFSLVVVNVDRQAQDWQAYERVLGKLQAPLRGYVSVRQAETVTSPLRLPLTLVVDAKGKVVQRIEGRVAPEVWDTVADLIN
jgi:thiol-disulfide isomerase/thioredoxin